MDPTAASTRSLQNRKRSITYIAVFGSLWGFSEATLGTTLHMFRVPFAGLVLTVIALNVILIARAFHNVPGSTLSIAFLAAVIKAVSFSTVKIGPIVGILLEGALAEGILTLMGTGRTGFITAGIALGMYPLIQSIVTRTVLFGSAFVPMILDLARGLSERFGGNLGWFLLCLYVVLHLLIGLAASLIAWAVRRRTAAELTASV